MVKLIVLDNPAIEEDFNKIFLNERHNIQFEKVVDENKIEFLFVSIEEGRYYQKELDEVTEILKKYFPDNTLQIHGTIESLEDNEATFRATLTLNQK